MDATGALLYVMTRTPSLSGIKMNLDAEGLEFFGDEKAIAKALNYLLDDSSRILEEKMSKLRDFSVPRNDMKTYRVVTGGESKSFNEAMSWILKKVRFDDNTIYELSRTGFKERRGEITLTLGSGPELSMPMLFLVERTEASYQWGKGRGGRSMN